ncbi:MAG: aminoglycoside phosphotransferase family protein [Bacteroidota bacterium]
MQSLISRISIEALSEELISSHPISGLGSVNEIYAFDTAEGKYILRLNNFEEKQIEYRKEKFCLEAVGEMGIPGPKVLAMGQIEEHVYMIQNRLGGENAKEVGQESRNKIWRALGTYARQFHEITKIEDEAVKKQEFHADWKARLTYNLKELNPSDSLLQLAYLQVEDHEAILSVLLALDKKDFKTGLVHGDLCPRNVLMEGENIYLLDWGTAEINVVPHTEIGILLLSEEASAKEISIFLQGLGITQEEYREMEKDIHALNLLHRLDKYRWAEAYDQDNLDSYVKKIKAAFHPLIQSQSHET